MDLEEHSLPSLKDRCEECGTPLTQAEIDAAAESGKPFLCTTHATEQLDYEPEEEGEEV